MITIEYDPKKIEIKIRGHADYAPKGQDIVCAAVSVLGQTLALCIQERKPRLTKSLHIDSTDGLTIRCLPLPKYKSEVEILYQFVMCGIAHLSQQYPQHIQII